MSEAQKKYYRSEKGKAARAKYLEQTRERRKAYQQANYHKNSERQYWRTVELKYGITRAEWDCLFESQGRKCGMCGVTSNSGRWHTDHCHETGLVRGILCTRCNTTLGRFGDTAEKAERTAQQALAYLRGEV